MIGQFNFQKFLPYPELNSTSHLIFENTEIGSLSFYMRAHRVFPPHRFSTSSIRFGKYGMFSLVRNSLILQLSRGTRNGWVGLANFSLNHMAPTERKNTGKLSISQHKSKRKNDFKFGIRKMFFLMTDNFVFLLKK